MPAGLANSAPYQVIGNGDRLAEKSINRTLLNASRNTIFVSDALGAVTRSNHVAQKTFGLFPGAMVQSTLPALWKTLKPALIDRRHLAAQPFACSHGAFLATFSPIQWQAEFMGMLCILDDVTELEKVARRLKNMKRLNMELDAIINTSSDGLWICDADANVIRINRASERINRVSARQVVGRNMRDLEKEGFISRSVTLAVIADQAETTILQITRDGRKLMTTGSPIFDEDGCMFRIVVNEHDITEIDALRREIETQGAIQDQYRRHLYQMQAAELASKTVIAKSPSFVKTVHQAIKAAAVNSTVLLLGESGVGKGLIANLIHQHSQRAKAPMIKLNCGAIPEALVESELFGYVKGAFTGALDTGKPGHVELAHGSMLFLDEIGDLPLPSQVKLLRFLEDGHVMRIGDTTPRRFDVRIVAATNRKLKDMVATGKFREDLYYRLNVIPLRVPPLRERRACILPLLHYYLKYFGKRLGLQRKIRFTRSASDALAGYAYPGNVRELMNLCERLLVMTDKDLIELQDLPEKIEAAQSCPEFHDAWETDGNTLAQILENVERRVLRRALDKMDTQAEMAAALGLNQSTIARKLRKYRIRVKDPLL